MAGNENSGERLFVTVTNKGPVRRYVDGVLVLETDDDFSVLANRVDPQGVAALLERCEQQFSNSHGKCLSRKSADDVEVVDSNAPSPSARKQPPEAAVAVSSKVPPVKKNCVPHTTQGERLTRTPEQGVFKGCDPTHQTDAHVQRRELPR